MIVLALSCLVWLQDTPKENPKPLGAKEVIDKYIEAKGGADLLTPTPCFKMVTDVYVDGILLGKYQLFRSGAKFMDKYTLNDKSSLRRGVSGDTVWVINFENEPSIFTGQEAESFKLEYCSQRKSIRWRDAVDQIKYGGLKNFRGRKVHELVFPKENDVRRFFDIESGLLIGSRRQLDDEEKTVLESEFSDFAKASNGYVYAKRTTRRYGTQYTREFRCSSLEINPDMDMNLFATPKSVQKLQREKSDRNK